MTKISTGSWKKFFLVFGPGLLVMLADTEVGSIITAGQSGILYGYKLLLLQIFLIPVLYIVQELTVRLGIFSGQGHMELIKNKFGKNWAYLSMLGLIIAVMGALITEFAGVAMIGELFGVTRFITLPLAALALLLIVFRGSYNKVEKVAIIIGLFELVFFGIAWISHPNLKQLTFETFDIPLHDQKYLFYVAANIGAVIMPWMVFYQQAAIVDKGLKEKDLKNARLDTGIGAVVTQFIMIAVLVSTAATLLNKTDPNSIDSSKSLINALTPYLGVFFGKIIFSIGILGAALVAAVVSSLALAWSIGELTGNKHSLDYKPLEAPIFFGAYGFCVIGGALLVAFIPDVISLSVNVQIVNALLLPLVLGFLVALSMKALPSQYKLKGTYLYIVIIIVLITCLFAILGSFGGLF
jgi:hypothetical protein